MPKCVIERNQKNKKIEPKIETNNWKAAKKTNSRG
jgi:hypothetical protein